MDVCLAEVGVAPLALNRQNTPRPGRSGLRFFRMLAAMLSLAAVGCAGQGIRYTRVASPYSLDFHGTPAGGKTCRVNEHILREPVSGAAVSASFTLRGVEEAAREAGITNLYYADMEIFDALNGLY